MANKKCMRYNFANYSKLNIHDNLTIDLSNVDWTVLDDEAILEVLEYIQTEFAGASIEQQRELGVAHAVSTFLLPCNREILIDAYLHEVRWEKFSPIEQQFDICAIVAKNMVRNLRNFQQEILS